MKNSMLMISFLLAINSFAQTEEINDSFGYLPQLMVVANTDEKLAPIDFDLAEYNKQVCSEELIAETPDERFLSWKDTKPYLTLDNEKYKFEVAFVSSFGGEFSNLEKQLENESQDYKDVGKDMRDFIAKDYASFADREAAMEELCAGKSEKERLALVSHLSKKLAGIYDYQRAGGGPNSGYVVSSEMQWNALNQKSKGVDAASGVCRDAISTVSAFAQ